MDWVLFSVFAVISLVSALGVVLARNTVHSALFLVATLLSMAVFFVMQQAHFLAAVQVIVYAGAVVVLFLFVIMLLGVDREEDLGDRLRFQRPLAALLGAALLGGFLLLADTLTPTGGQSLRGEALGSSYSNVENVARSLFSDFLWPFEITSVLLVIAVVGAVLLARRDPDGGPDERSGAATDGSGVGA